MAAVEVDPIGWSALDPQFAPVREPPKMVSGAVGERPEATPAARGSGRRPFDGDGRRTLPALDERDLRDEDAIDVEAGIDRGGLHQAAGEEQRGEGRRAHRDWPETSRLRIVNRRRMKTMRRSSLDRRQERGSPAARAGRSRRCSRARDRSRRGDGPRIEREVSPPQRQHGSECGTTRGTRPRSRRRPRRADRRQHPGLGERWTSRPRLAPSAGRPHCGAGTTVRQGSPATLARDRQRQPLRRAAPGRTRRRFQLADSWAADRNAGSRPARDRQSRARRAATA